MHHMGKGVWTIGKTGAATKRRRRPKSWTQMEWVKEKRTGGQTSKKQNENLQMDSQLYATQCTFEKHDSFLVVCFVVRPYLFSLFLSRSFFVALDDFLLLLLFIRFFKYVLNSYCSHSCSTSKCVPDTLFSSSLSLLLPLSLLLLLLLTFRKSFRCTDFSRFEKKQNPKKHLLSLFSHFLFTISILHFYWATVSISPYVEQTHTLAHTQ